MIAIGTATVLSSIITALAGSAASPLQPQRANPDGGPQWHFLWNSPPPVDYVVSKSLSCGSDGTAWPVDNSAALPIQKIVIHSSPGVIKGVTVTYYGSDPVVHGHALGTIADVTLVVPDDKWVSTVKAGCTGAQLTYLAFGHSNGKQPVTMIEAGSAKEIQSWEWDFSAAFQFTGAAKDGALSAFGANFSEVENPDEDSVPDEVETQ